MTWENSRSVRIYISRLGGFRKATTNWIIIPGVISVTFIISIVAGLSDRGRAACTVRFHRDRRLSTLPRPIVVCVSRWRNCAAKRRASQTVPVPRDECSDPRSIPFDIERAWSGNYPRHVNPRLNFHYRFFFFSFFLASFHLRVLHRPLSNDSL